MSQNKFLHSRGMFSGQTYLMRSRFSDKPNGHNQICQAKTIEDARLIAAAPDMLAALIRIQNHNVLNSKEAWEQVEAAIHKATKG